ncbi:multidrug resistance protein, MATE family [Micromonospora pallida]|uniref:Probable multidrug resistance protein NorM n=1 Tax=Micromonospora pallida TaxID=145854 RepID=A0A1C6SAV1_9ACTN|nr:MATE family efflux transporter [Micromonospora pallida]SCL26600.1 multidrug resistance protein, MATE family [Micromonospora pallida]
MAAPLYLSMVAASAGSLVVTATLGRFGTAALAAFALAGAVYFPATAAVAGAVRGIMPFVSSAAGDREAVLRLVRDGSWLAVAVGALGAVAVAGVPLLARAGGVPTKTVAALGVFPLLLAGSVLLGSIGAMASSSLVGLGRTKVVMWAGLVAATCTAGLSLLLVNGFGPVPPLGLVGAGGATVVANLAACAVNLHGLRSTLGVPLVSLVMARPDLRRVRDLAMVGIPMAGTVLVKFGVLGVLAFAAARISTPAAATHGVATSLVGLTFTAAVAVGQAGVPLVSSRATAGDVPGVRRVVRAGLLVTAASVGSLGVLLLVLRPALLPVFTDDPDVRSLLTGLLPVVALAVLGDGLQAVLGFGLTGLRRTIPSFVVFSALYGVLALVALPVAAATGIVGLWTALVVTNALVALGQGTAFLRVSGRLREPAQDRSHEA